MATETGKPLPARRADGAPASPRLRGYSAETSGSVAGPARSTSGSCGHVLPTPRGLGRPVRLWSRRDPRRRALGPGFARPCGVVLDGPRRSGCEGGQRRDAFGQSDRRDRVCERDAPVPHSPANEPAEPGPNRQGFRFAKRITMHIESEPAPAGFEPERSSTEGMDLSPEEQHPD